MYVDPCRSQEPNPISPTRFGKSPPPKSTASDPAQAGHYVHVKIAWVFPLSSALRLAPAKASGPAFEVLDLHGSGLVNCPKKKKLGYLFHLSGLDVVVIKKLIPLPCHYCSCWLKYTASTILIFKEPVEKYCINQIHMKLRLCFEGRGQYISGIKGSWEATSIRNLGVRYNYHGYNYLTQRYPILQSTLFKSHQRHNKNYKIIDETIKPFSYSRLRSAYG